MMNKLKITLGATLTVFLLPLVTFAQEDGISFLIQKVGDVINGVIPLLIGLAVLFFLWGVFKFFFFQTEDDKSAGRRFMVWGIVALFVMVSVWGLVRILASSVIPEGQNAPLPAPPGVPTNTNN